MIVALLSDPYIRAALERAARSEEDVVWTGDQVVAAVELGTPRLVVCHAEGARPRPVLGVDAEVPILTLTRATLCRWESERHRVAWLPARMEYLADRLREQIRETAVRTTWVDVTLRDLARVSGAPLPPPLRGFARRVLEFPFHYVDLRAVASACGTTRGALKARFRRRGLASPSTYLRWFRVMAGAYLLSDRSVSVARAAYMLGYTTDGNFCRSIQSVSRLTPTEVRTVRGWNRLLVRFSWLFLRPESLEAWGRLDDLFVRTAA